MIRKAVLPVAGFGTRCLPASKAIPKEMITIVDRPVIQYVVNEAVAAGIRDIVLVTHASKSAIENHFDKHFELEASLEAKDKQDLLDELRAIVPEDVNIISVRQPEPLGLGHAVLCARPVIGDDEPFAVLLPDVLVDDDGLEHNDLAGMIEAFEASGRSQLMVEEVPWENVHKYGIVDPRGGAPSAGESCPLNGVVEKPSRDEAPSNLAVIGRYILPGSIFALLAKTPPAPAMRSSSPMPSRRCARPMASTPGECGARPMTAAISSAISKPPWSMAAATRASARAFAHSSPAIASRSNRHATRDSWK
ncbi:UTP--glucose-1-phosphate uridylyltransferase subunit GalU [Halomonas sp. BC04]|nr:UTP--glucose-1-phosphate uridylyltransferase subunit GalU [Halomonas sp. BC04]